MLGPQTIINEENANWVNVENADYIEAKIDA
jgi:hypothetical protein